MVIKLMLAVSGLLILGMVVHQEPIERDLQLRHRDFRHVSYGGIDCDNYSADIRTAFQQLQSGEYTPTTQARNMLLAYAKSSSLCRNEVIRTLMGEMDKPDLNLERQISNYFIWREGSRLLGELKATEALDLLISHLDMTTGLHSASMVFQPAILGVRQMGPAAVPKLAVALKQSPKAGVRMAAAYCLTDIGGMSAMNALRQAQDGEANQCVARFIKISLGTFSYKTKGHVSFDNEAPQANIDARRNWLTAFECIE